MIEPLQVFSDTCQVNFHDVDMKMIQTTTYSITKGIQYVHLQFQQPPHWDIDKKGVVIYQPANLDQGFIQLTYILTETALEHKPGKESKKSTPKMVEMTTIVFDSGYLEQFAASGVPDNTTDKILSFQQKESFTTVIQLCQKTQLALDSMRDHPYAHSLRNMFIQSQAQMLLLYALEDCLLDEKEEHFVCKFLVNEIDQVKIAQAKELLIQRIGNPITIKELSRKVAMNECYLKKGFKEIVGSTIFEFYQSKRMEYATMMLREKGLNVTEVSDLLGYSSISHFSTAFKKYTGIKPCELLFR